MTMAASRHKGWPRSATVGPLDCKFGTIQYPRARSVSLHRPAHRLGASTLPAQPRDKALSRRNDALQWVNAALHFIRHVQGLALVQRLTNIAPLKMTLFGIENTEQINALKVHFKFQEAPKSLSFLNELEAVYVSILNVLMSADTFFANDMVTTAFAYAYPGALKWADSDLRKKIFFGVPYLGKAPVFQNGPLFQTSVIVHEAAHFVDSRIGHTASELPKFDGTAVDSAKNYAQMTNDEAFRNAYSYAQFALHAFKRTDYRITPFDE